VRSGRRYEWPCPGDLLHVDWTTLARFAEPGQALTGDRTSSAAKKRRKLGYDVVPALVDDHSRFAYAEVLADAKACTVTGFIERALAAFAAHGIEASQTLMHFSMDPCSQRPVPGGTRIWTADQPSCSSEG